SLAPSFQLMERRFWILWTINISIMWRPIESGAEMCPAALMEASPGAVIQHGHPFNLTCTLTGNAKPCNPGSQETIKIYRQKTLVPGLLKGNSVTVQDLRPPPGETIYLCWKCKTLCVMSVLAGYPPDQPRSVSCEQEGEAGKLTCTWEPGRETFLETTCKIQLLQKTHNVTVSSKYSSQVNQSVLLPVTVAMGGEYTVLVRASNELGEKVSAPYSFTYIDAVKPYPPSDITVTCDRPDTCTATIHTDQDVRHFRLRYCITHERVWEQVETSGNRSVTLRGLRPLSLYEFQAACKYVINGGKWSNWSNIVTHETPEEAPHGIIDVWYRVHWNNKAVTVFWKYMNLPEFKGQIRFYQVRFHGNDTHIENTTETWLSRNIDTEGCEVAVSAHNTMGSSAPVYIRVTTDRPSDFPPPTNVIAITSGPRDLALRWERPAGSERAGDQIITWEDPTGTEQSHTNWILVPKNNTSVTVSGHLRPYICYQFFVYLLWGRRAGLPGITRGSVQQTAPLTAPKFKYEVHKNNTILVTWREIPAEVRMGCILYYSIYIRASAQATRVIRVPSNQSRVYQYEIDTIKSNVQYSLEMTCWNEAGESPRSPLLSAHVQPEVSEDITGVVVSGVILLFMGLLISISLARRRVQFLPKILPQWWSKPVPDPANCEWAKEYISSKEKREILRNVTSSISDCDAETETLEVEEMASEEEEESPTPVFSYKIHVRTIEITQEENKTSPGPYAPAWPIKPAQGGTYKPLVPDNPPLDYLVHYDRKSPNYLLHHDDNRSNYLLHHNVKPLDKLVQQEVTPSSVHQDINLSSSMAHHDVTRSDYLSHHDINPSDNLSHHDVNCSDYPAHPGKSDYLAQYTNKLSDVSTQQDAKPLHSMVSYIETSTYLAYNEDYLPSNMATIMEDLNKDHKDLFHRHLFLLSAERTTNPISLDTVQVSFPSAVQ
ncbi:interleukin-12 receptor subunit beta-2, partial [Leptodactylus fuscus]|uniref:interleukin-12 receptor subunit beta-2 n=1 Tax=Leptodactylus fuscus TaxID=238119 RepID=UPI003F4F03B5